MERVEGHKVFTIKKIIEDMRELERVNLLALENLCYLEYEGGTYSGSIQYRKDRRHSISA